MSRKTNREEIITLLSKLVEINTVNNPREGATVGASVAREVLQALQEHGLADFEIIEPRGSPIILAKLGEGRPIGLYLAHVDTVPPGEGWDTPPFKLTVKGDRAIGRGAADDKGNVAAMALALGRLRPGKGTVITAFTSDEETGGFKGALGLLEWLRGEGLLPDYVVNGDGAFSRVIIRRRNVFLTTLATPRGSGTARGCVRERVFKAALTKPTMHAAYFTPGVDTHPLLQASEWVRTNGLLVSELWVENVKNNVIPQRVRVRALAPCGSPEEQCGGEDCGEHYYDPNLTQLLRALLPAARSPLTTQAYSDHGVTLTPNTYYLSDRGHEIELDIRAMATDENHVRHLLSQALEENNVPQATVEVTSGGGFLSTPRDHWLVRLASETNRELGLDPEPMEAAGASDSRHFSVRAIPAIDYGPLGWNIHGPNEAVSIPHLVKALEFYLRLAEKIHANE